MDWETYGARSEKRLLEKSSPASAATGPMSDRAKRKLRYLATDIAGMGPCLEGKHMMRASS
jgi:hypothetical protein